MAYDMIRGLSDDDDDLDREEQGLLGLLKRLDATRNTPGMPNPPAAPNAAAALPTITSQLTRPTNLTQTAAAMPRSATQSPRSAAPRPKAKWGTPETIAAILTLIGAFGKGRTRQLAGLGSGFLQGRSAAQRGREAEWWETQTAERERADALELLGQQQEGALDLESARTENDVRLKGIAQALDPLEQQKLRREQAEADALSTLVRALREGKGTRNVPITQRSLTGKMGESLGIEVPENLERVNLGERTERIEYSPGEIEGMYLAAGLVPPKEPKVVTQYDIAKQALQDRYPGLTVEDATDEQWNKALEAAGLRGMNIQEMGHRADVGYGYGRSTAAGENLKGAQTGLTEAKTKEIGFNINVNTPGSDASLNAARASAVLEQAHAAVVRARKAGSGGGAKGKDKSMTPYQVASLEAKYDIELSDLAGRKAAVMSNAFITPQQKAAAVKELDTEAVNLAKKKAALRVPAPAPTPGSREDPRRKEARKDVAGRPAAYVAGQVKAYKAAGRKFDWVAVRKMLLLAGVKSPDNFKPKAAK